MFSLLRILSLAVLFAVPLSSAFAASAYVHELTGTMTGQYGTGPTRALKIGDTLDSGVTLSTGDRSTAIVKFEDGQLVVLQPNTRFVVREYSYNPRQIRDSNVVFQLLQGGLRFVTGVIGASNRNAFKLNVGTATIGVRGTAGDAIYDQIANIITVAVDQGALDVMHAGVIRSITAGNFTTGSLSAALDAARPAAQASYALLVQLAASRGITLPDNLPAVIKSAAEAAAAKEAARVALALYNANPTAENKALADQAQKLADALLQTAIFEAQQAIADAAKQQGVRLPPPPPPPVNLLPEEAAERRLENMLRRLQPTPTPTPTPVSR